MPSGSVGIIIAGNYQFGERDFTVKMYCLLRRGAMLRHHRSRRKCKRYFAGFCKKPHHRKGQLFPG
jgi:hypothetical protein